jgi:chemotaxis protein methyltransferase CheR
VATALDNARYAEFAGFLAKRLGIILGDNKQYLVKSRLSSTMREFESEDINSFIATAVSGRNAKLTERALECMTTNETFWFRDEYPYQILSTALLPMLAKRQQKLRIWSSACSYGQEPYSIAMMILEYKKLNPSAFAYGIEIIASDISQKVLDAAQTGCYDELAIARGLPEAMQRTYFSRCDKNRLCVSESLRKMVTFKRANLLDNFSAHGQFDVIFCRNVLIYFDNQTKASILQKIAALLPSTGALILGAAESIVGAEDVLQMQKCPRGLYYTRRV